MKQRRWLILATCLAVLMAITGVLVTVEVITRIHEMGRDNQGVQPLHWQLHRNDGSEIDTVFPFRIEVPEANAVLRCTLPDVLPANAAIFIHLNAQRLYVMVDGREPVVSEPNAHTSGRLMVELSHEDAGKQVEVLLSGVPANLCGYRSHLGARSGIRLMLLGSSLDTLMLCMLLSFASYVGLLLTLPLEWRHRSGDMLDFMYWSFFYFLSFVFCYIRTYTNDALMIQSSMFNWLAILSSLLLPVPMLLIARNRFALPQYVKHIALVWGFGSLAMATAFQLLEDTGYWVRYTTMTALWVFAFLSIGVAVLSVWHMVKERNLNSLELCIGTLTVGLGIAATVSTYVSQADTGYMRFFHWGLLCAVTCSVCDLIRQRLMPFVRRQGLEELRIREEEYRIAAKHSGKFIMRYDVATRRTHYQPETAAFFGLPETAHGMPDTAIGMGRIAAQSIREYRMFYERILNGEPGGSCVFGMQTPDGEVVWLHADFTTIFDQEGRPKQSIISCYEIKGLREKEAAYRRLREEYEAIPPESAVWFEVDLTNALIASHAGHLIGSLVEDIPLNMEQAVAFAARETVVREDRPAFESLLDRGRLLSAYEQDVREDELDYHRITKDGPKWTRISLRMIADPYSSAIRAFAVFHDVEEEKKKEGMQRKFAVVDELTGLLSRTSFIERFTELCEESREGTHQAIIMIDLDGFKAVNDTFGHRFGDTVLSDVAASLRALMRGDDLLCRLGGDEFILCLKNVPVDEAFLERRCESIRRALSKQFSDEVAMSGSLGVAVYPRDGQTFDDLYQHADQALYAAKQNGRNRTVFYDTESSGVENGASPAPMRQTELRRPTESDKHTVLVVDDQRMNRAIMKGIFEPEYNVIEAADGREALKIIHEQAQKLSAIVLDLIMPDVGGLDVLSEMNEDPYYQSIPVIVVSAASEEEYSLKAIELGAADFVVKPIDERLVRLRVRNAIFRRETENLRSQNRDLLVQRSDEERRQNQLRYQAEHDPLTQIRNKNAFLRYAREQIDQHPDRVFAVVSLDVRRFHAVNDIFGHEEGDRLLRYVAMQLQTVIGDRGPFARLDTDNFVFCIPFEKDELEQIMDRLMESMRGYDLSFEVELSFGVYVVEDRTQSVSHMMDRAEMAKRSVKGSYLDRRAYYNDAMREHLLEEQEIVGRMHAALEAGEFVVYYQPKCRLDTGMIVGAEALVRWEHATRGLMNPAAFIPIFERNGFIMQLDVYVWEQVCRFLQRRLQAEPNDGMRISVNISRANLYNPNLCHTLADLCDKYQIPRERMEVEITESAYVENAHLLLGLTDELHSNGFTVEMDDFGSGYSSLNMLKEIPVDVLKLDLHFLYGVQGNDRGGSILSNVVNMANQLRLRVVAEGVENEDQARFLAGIGCRVAQGYYYARPMPEAEFLERLAAQRNPVEAPDGVADAKQQLTQLLCPAVLCAATGEGLRLIDCNEYYRGLMHIQNGHMDREDMLLDRWVSAEDRRLLVGAMLLARERGELTQCIYLQRDVHERHHLLNASVRFVSEENGQAVYLITITPADKRATKG